jgi:hypothetical protein
MPLNRLLAPRNVTPLRTESILRVVNMSYTKKQVTSELVYHRDITLQPSVLLLTQGDKGKGGDPGSPRMDRFGT